MLASPVFFTVAFTFAAGFAFSSGISFSATGAFSATTFAFTVETFVSAAFAFTTGFAFLSGDVFSAAGDFFSAIFTSTAGISFSTFGESDSTFCSGVFPSFFAKSFETVFAFFAGAFSTGAAAILFCLRTAKPSNTAVEITFAYNATARGESSFPGIMKSIPVGSQFVSEIPTTGIPNFWASLSASCSLWQSVMNNIEGMLFMLRTPPRERVNFMRLRSIIKASFLITPS